MVVGNVAGHEAEELRNKDIRRNINYGLDTKLKIFTLGSRSLFLCGLLDLQLLYTDRANFAKDEMI